MGRLIPAGTGLPAYKRLQVVLDAMATPRPLRANGTRSYAAGDCTGGPRSLPLPLELRPEAGWEAFLALQT